MAETNARLFQKAYKKGYDEGRKDAASITTLYAASSPISVQPVISPTKLAMSRFNDAAAIKRRGMVADDWKQPLMIAVVTGGFTFVGLSLSSFGFVLFFDYGSARLYGGLLWASTLIGVGVAFAQWVGFSSVIEAGLWGLEGLTGRDMDGDGKVGKPTPVDAPIGKIHVQLSKKNSIIGTIGITKQQARDAYNVMYKNGWVFSRASMDNVMTQSEQSEMYARHKAHGLYENPKNNDGLLNDNGRKFWATLAK